jgi:cation diffusion facilitator family transporter
MASVKRALRISALAICVNMILAATKIVAGVLGNSYVLIADGIESTSDIFSSIIVWSGIRVASLPADAKHPYGHGKAEPIATSIVAVLLLGAAVLIAVQSYYEITHPHAAPHSFTLVVLIAVIAVKEFLYRVAWRTGSSLDSAAMKADAWHHRSDALTSAAAFVGITIALIGGPGFETADDWAALVACAIIAWNGIWLFKGAMDQIMDASASPGVVEAVRNMAADVEGVVAIEKCRVRKVGLHIALDIHVVVNGDLSVRRGHAIAHEVEARLMESQHRINDVVVHIEPAGERVRPRAGITKP